MQPTIVTAIHEASLATVVTTEVAASGVAIGIKDYWRCIETLCNNWNFTCWVRHVLGQLPHYKNHYKLILPPQAYSYEPGSCSQAHTSFSLSSSISLYLHL